MERSTGCIIAGCSGPAALLIVVVITLLVGPPPDRDVGEPIAQEAARPESISGQLEDAFDASLYEVSEEEHMTEEKGQIVECKIVVDANVDYSTIVRKNYHVVCPDMRRDDLESTATHMIDDIRSKGEEIDGISMLFYNDEDLVYSGNYIGLVEWAPNGVWADITPAIGRSNDRSSYELNIEYGDGLN